MSKQVSVQSPSFSIRFKPASALDDDDVCDMAGGLQSSEIGHEAVLFERLSNSDELPPPSECAETSKPVVCPASLWKDSQAILSHSAPVSELTSPMSPSASGSSVAQEKPTVIKPASLPGVEKPSILSGLMEKLDRLSTESKETLYRKMKRSGSDDAKIASLLVDTEATKPSAPNADSVVESNNVPAVSDVQKCEIADQSTGRNCTAPAASGNPVHKSASSIEVAKADLVSASAASKLKRSSIGGGQDAVVMSHLLSGSTSQSDNRQSVSSTSSIKKSDLTENLSKPLQPDGLSSHSRKPEAYLSSYFKVPYLSAFLVAVAVYVIIPMPAHVAGMLVGAILSSTCIFFYQRLTRSRPTAVPSHDWRLSTTVTADVRESKNMEGKFQGWMNELSHYDASEFHINDTHSVYVTLEACTLRLQTPKHGIPKRAICDEHIPKFSCVRQRHFDLEGGQVDLLPRGLVTKRLWCKKYPICLIPRSSQTHTTSAMADVSNVDASKKQTILYLFTRTSRDKEQWYRRFLYATRGTPWPTRLSDVVGQNSAAEPSSTLPMTVSWQRHYREASSDSISPSCDEPAPPAVKIDFSRMLPEHNVLDYTKYMSAVMPPSTGDPVDSESPPSMTYLNALIGRLFLDFLREKYWAEKMRDKIQKKLCKMHVPHFINQLTVTGIELGCSVPSVRNVSAPYLDGRGFWLDVDIDYTGGFCLSMETKCNLMRLKYASTVSTSSIPEESTVKLTRCGAMCSDEEDSAESTTDEDNVEDNTSEDATDERRSVPMGKKLLQFVDKISQSRYFQQATEYKYIKRAMEEVSNTRLVLNVELRSIVGTLAINIPPPPTDRFWYGFRTKPELVLFAKPCVGDREVNLSPVTDWIEKKLAIEFQRVFVMPNMDDIPISLMCAHLQPDVSDEVPHA